MKALLPAGWKAPVAYAKIREVANTKVAAHKENINTPDKENAVYVAGLTFPLKKGDPDYAALLLGNHLLGGNFQSRLITRLRQNEGLCYGCGSGLRVDLAYSGNLGRRMKRANRVAAAASVLVGEDELARGAATVRNMDSGTQEEVALASLEEYLARYR